MPVELKVPAVGESITEVQIGEWRKAEGDTVEKDENLVEIETDKATVELPAPITGVISKVLKRNGETAQVGEIIGYMDVAAVGASPAPAAPQDEAAAAAAKAHAAEMILTPSKEKATAAKAAPSRPAGSSAKPARPAGKTSETPPADSVPDQALVVSSEAPRPVVKEIRKKPLPETIPISGASLPKPGREEEAVPMSPIRRRIAQRLVEAQQTAALLTTFNEIDMTAVMALRNQHKDVFQEKFGIKLGFMSFFVKASIDALKLVPQVNAEIRPTTSSTITISTSALPWAAAKGWSCRCCATPTA